MAVDLQGNVYVTGGTQSSDFPRTMGPPHAGDMDAFVAKFDPTGRLLWSRLIGGPNHDRAYGVEVRPDGNEILLCGRAGPGLPTQACPTCDGRTVQRTFAGDTAPNKLYGPEDGFAGKLDPDGTLLWLSYFGDDSNGIVRDCDIDRAGNVYVAYGGSTNATPNLATPGAYRTTHYRGTGNDILVAELDPEGRGVTWATYLGGTGHEGGAPSVRVQDDGSVHVLTSTQSKDWPLVDPVQQHLNGARDFAIARIAPDGSSLLFSSYLGGSGSLEFEGTHNLGLDAAGVVYVCGATDSRDFPGAASGHRSAFGGGPTDGFVSKVRPSHPAAVLASTYVGGSGRDGEMSGCDVDANGNVLVSSGASSTDFPTAAPYQARNAGGSDATAVLVASDLGSLRSSSYLGGSGDDEGRAAVIDHRGNLIVVGGTRSADFPTRNAHQKHHAENPPVQFDAFVAAFAPAPPPQSEPSH